MAEDNLSQLHDRLYRLESAIEDVDSDLRSSHTLKAYREAFEHLYEAASDLVTVVVDQVRP